MHVYHYCIYNNESTLKGLEWYPVCGYACIINNELNPQRALILANGLTQQS